MKKTCIRVFSFHPEEYRSMENYLSEMLLKGWKLSWCRGVFAGFEKIENKKIRYVVDPYAVTALSNLGKFPKYRLNEYMENGWYAVGKSKGCYIFCTEDIDVDSPKLEDGFITSVQKTCRNASIIVELLLATAIYKLISTPAVLYSIVLTDIYIVIMGLMLFLILYYLINIIVLTSMVSKTKTLDVKSSKRFIIRDIGIFIFFVFGTYLEVRQQSELLGYLVLPVAVVVVGSIILKLVAERTKNATDNNRRLIPVICIIALVLLILIPTSIHSFQENSKEAAKDRQTELLMQANTTTVIYLSDFTSVSDAKKQIQQNQSILGNNILYAEELGGLSVFTNYTQMKSKGLAKPIFEYLYMQAQLDYNGSFQQKVCNGIVYYKIEESNVFLVQNEEKVYLCAVPDTLADEEVLEILGF